MNWDWERFIEALLHRSPPHILEHIWLVIVPLGLAIAISVPIGIFLTRSKYRRFAPQILGVLNAGQTIPPLAVIAVCLPLWGLGFWPAVASLTFYALLPIARNTIAGLNGVAVEIKEAALGMGMSSREVFFQVELPLSLPVILAGIKTSSVLTVGTATLAALVGADGMGAVIFAGINFFQAELIVAGTLIIGLIAIIIERIITLVEVLAVPKHLK